VQSVHLFFCNGYLVYALAAGLHHLPAESQRQTKGIRREALEHLVNQVEINRLEIDHVVNTEKQLFGLHLGQRLLQIIMKVGLPYHLAVRIALKDVLVLGLKYLRLVQNIRLDQAPWKISVETSHITFELQRTVPCKHNIAYHCHDKKTQSDKSCLTCSEIKYSPSSTALFARCLTSLTTAFLYL